MLFVCERLFNFNNRHQIYKITELFKIVFETFSFISADDTFVTL